MVLTGPLAVLVTMSIDLSPLQVLLLDGFNVTRVRRNIGNDRAHVRIGPGSPVELNGATSSDLGKGVRRALGAGVLVADDVGSAKRVWLYEAIVKVLGVPADVLGDWGIVLLGVVVVELEAADVLAINGNTVGGTVGGSSSSQSSDGAEGSNRLVHGD